ncbi:S-type pyocin domain-containing protein [Pseudomonas sp. HLT2-19-2]
MMPAPRTSNTPKDGPFGRGVPIYYRNQNEVKATTKVLEQQYQTRSSELPQTIEAELAATRHEGPTEPVPPLQSVVRELGVLNKLTQRKTVEFHSNTSTAHAFYGGDPFNRHINEFMIKATKMEKWPGPNGIAMQALNQSLRAAIEARLLAQTLQSLHQRTVNLQHTLSVMQAAEQARLAAEQEAQRVAAEQARIRAEAEALAHAQEQARLAALAEAERLATEQSRIAAEAAARYIAEERARLEAQETKEREEVNAKQRAEGLARLNAMVAMFESWEVAKNSRPFPVSASAVAAGPVFTLATGRLATSAATTQAIRAALQTGVAAVITAGTAVASPVIVGFASLLFPSPLGNGDLRQLSVPLSDLAPDNLHAWSLSLSEYEPDSLHALSVPLADLIPTHLNSLRPIGEANGEIELPIAIGSRTVGNTTEFVVAAANGTTVPGKIPVRLATYDPSVNAYRSYNPDAPSIGMTWTPIVKPNNASTSLPPREPNIVVYDGTTLTALEGRIDTHPELDLYSFGGFITVFPVDSGIPPTFTMFRDRRDDPGVASGDGQPVSGNWLGAASTGQGAPIPMQIADKFRGREFSSFKSFRRAFWKAVASDEYLFEQFDRIDKASIKHGLSPKPHQTEHVGKRRKYEIHHVTPIDNGGAVYDIDNLRILTPKQHIQTHSKKGQGD